MVIYNSPEYLSLRDLPNEIWMDIKNYEGLYMISNYGRVKSLGRKMSITNNNGTIYDRIYKPKILKQNIIKTSGYLFVNLTDYNGSKTPKTVHRLVAINFVNNENNHPLVMHKDNNKQNNLHTNLSWGTSSENIQSSYDDGLHSNCRKILQITKDGKVVGEYDSIAEATRQLNKKHSSAIANCLCKLSSTAYGFVWRYNERKDNYGNN